MKEARRDRRTRGGQRPNAFTDIARARRRQRGRFGGMRSRPNACRSMPARRAKEVSTGTN